MGFSVEAPPEFLTGLFVERDDQAAFSTDYADQFVAVDQGMSTVPPKRRFCTVVLGEVA